MEYVNQKRLTCAGLIILPFAFSLLTSCGGGGSGGGGNGGGSADTEMNISEKLNLNSGSTVLLDAKNKSMTNGSGIGKIVTAGSASPQPGNGYTASTVDIVNVATNSIAATLNFAANSPSLITDATASQLAAFIDIQSDDVDASASTIVRLTLSTASIAFGDQFSVNGATVTGNTKSEVMADINALPDITASIDSNGVITVTATDGNDLRLNLNNPASGQTIAIESLSLDASNAIMVIDSETIGSGQPNTKATVGGSVEVTLDYPLQLLNPGNGNIFGTTTTSTYEETNNFDVDDADTYNDAGSVAITDSDGNDHILTEYFVKQNDLAGTQPNRWKMYVLVDGRNVGPNDSNGDPTLAVFDIAFDTNGQLDTAATDDIAISQWVPLDSNGNPNGADSARITIDITGSTQFGAPFTLTNVTIN